LRGGSVATAASLVLSTNPCHAIVERCGATSFERIEQINKGGGGTAAGVYSAQSRGSTQVEDLVMKESFPNRWYVRRFPPTSSADLVLKECDVIRRLNDANVENIEKCIDSCSTEEGSSRILLAPKFVVPSKGGSSDPDDTRQVVRSIRDTKVRTEILEKMTRTVVEMLAAGFASSDIQLLVNAESGEVLFIDFTETRPLTVPPNLDAVEQFLRDLLSYRNDYDDDGKTAISAAARSVLLDPIRSQGLSPQVAQLIQRTLL
jgi:hypothetical protein